MIFNNDYDTDEFFGESMDDDFSADNVDEELSFTTGFDAVVAIADASSQYPLLRKQRNIAFLCNKFERILQETEVMEKKTQIAIRKLSEFGELMGLDFNLHKDIVQIDDMIDDSIVVRFVKRKDIRLNIYFDEDSYDDGSMEEAYLSYKSEGVRYVENNSIEEAVRHLKQLLS